MSVDHKPRRLDGRIVFVSGGAGVIGQALVPALREAGAEITVGDLKPRPSHWPRDIAYRQGDLNELQAWEVAELGIDTFFHLAATFERTAETSSFWGETYRHNLRLSHHLMDLMKDLPTLRRVVFASSYLVYDPARYLFEQPVETPARLAETDPIRPRNLCGAAKLLHEAELTFLETIGESQFTSVAARIFRSYGRGSRDVISRWIRTCLQGEEIEVFNPEGLFDYVFADDVAEGLIRLADSDATGVYNLSRGRARRVSDVVDCLRDHFPRLRCREAPPVGDYEASEADMEQFRRTFGWRPETELEDAIPALIAFEKERPKASQVKLAPFNALVTSLSREIACVRDARRGLDKLFDGGRIFGGDCDDRCLGREVVDSFWHMPRLEALTVEDLIGFCRDNTVRAIIPTRDGELGYFASHRDRLESAGVRVMVSPLMAVRDCVDKLRFAEVLQSKGYPAIPTFETVEACDGQSLVVKERYGASNANVLIAVDRKTARQLADSNFSTPIFQPFLDGEEFSIDVFVAKGGEVKGGVARRRDLVIGGESQITTTVDEPGLVDLCNDIAKFLGLRGHAVFQALKDGHGQFWIIECNARVGGASSLAVACGLDSYYWFFAEAAGLDVSDWPFRRAGATLRQVRLPHDTIAPHSGF